MRKLAALLALPLVSGTAYCQSGGAYILPAGKPAAGLPPIVGWAVGKCIDCDLSAVERNAIDTTVDALISGRLARLSAVEVGIVSFPPEELGRPVNYRPYTLAKLSTAIHGCTIDAQSPLGPSRAYPNDRFYGLALNCGSAPALHVSLAFRNNKLVRAYLVTGKLILAGPAPPPPAKPLPER